MYPEKSIKTLMSEIGMSEDIAYASIRMTAMLMDLQLDDDKVVSTILQDCGLEVK